MKKTVFLAGVPSTTLYEKEFSLITTDRETEKETTHTIGQMLKATLGKFS